MNIGELLSALRKWHPINIKLPNKIAGIKILSGDRNDLSIIKVVNNYLTIQVDPSNTSPKSLKLLKIINASLTKGDELLEEGEVIESIEQLISENTDPVIKYFRGKLITLELELLQSSISLRKHFENEDMIAVSRIKNDILMRYGNHGGRISNLCTRHYFESDIIPMFLEMESEQSLDMVQFNTIYRNITDNFPIAVFINHTMTEDEVRSSIKTRMETNIKHGINYLYIHGIGERNIKIIDKVLSGIEQSSRWTIKSKEITQKKLALSIKLEFTEVKESHAVRPTSVK